MAYQSLLQDVTKEFARISAHIRSITASFSSLPECSSVSELVSGLQQLEKAKLEVTIALQLQQKAFYVDGNHKFNSSDVDSEESVDVLDLSELCSLKQQCKSLLKRCASIFMLRAVLYLTFCSDTMPLWTT